MKIKELNDVANAMMSKGLLAMDESIGTCNRRFADLGIPQTEEYRRNYRELLVTTPDLGSCLSGAILSDETIRQHKSDGTSFVEVLTQSGIIPGIKVDKSAKDMAGFPGEKVTEGLDGLRERL
ncbi:MAG TPA: class I fructose-bisphosphate aldolase, partial [Hanamia sp.]|nr:class I fructose-bisphosphate aldolase [Hanamia sp.]